MRRHVVDISTRQRLTSAVKRRRRCLHRVCLAAHQSSTRLINIVRRRHHHVRTPHVASFLPDITAPQTTLSMLLMTKRQVYTTCLNSNKNVPISLPFYFTARRYASARSLLSASVCPSVCLSVTLMFSSVQFARINMVLSASISGPRYRN